jgi:Domain of unknown function (DUF4376)
MISYFLHDAEGNIVSTGRCQHDNLHLMESSGLIARIGEANPAVNYYDIQTDEVRTYDDGALARREDRRGAGYRWSLGQWIDERSLDLAKAQKWNYIKRACTTAEFGTFTVSGYEFDCDHDSQTRIASAFQSAMDARTNGEPFSIAWTLADNTDVTLSRAQVIAVGRALQVHVNGLHDRCRQLRQQINSATTKAELDAIVW